MFQNLTLKSAPKGYIPKCETRHGIDTMRQWFKGDRIRLEMDLGTGHTEVTVDGRTIGRWDSITIKEWSDILYTLETEYSDKIEK